jgi:RNA methyltransferase, TrmH family
MDITSLQNAKIKKALKLWKRSEREEHDLFLIEGYRELKHAAFNKIEIETLFFCPKLFLGANENNLIRSLQNVGVQILECSEMVFRKLSYRDRPDGMLAIAKQRHMGLADIKKSENPFLVVAEGIEKPGNLGTILRSADGAGVDAVLVCDHRTDIHNPNVVRASVGALFTLPVIESESEKTFQWLKREGIAIVAASPSAKVEYTDADFTQPLAIVLGTEQFGLTKKWMEESDMKVRLPMRGVTDSLNVAMASTLLLYEVIRQRK